MESLRDNLGARVSLEGVVLYADDGRTVSITASRDFDVRVECSIASGEGELDESGDGDTDSSCIGRQEPAPYTDPECIELTRAFPDDVKY